MCFSLCENNIFFRIIAHFIGETTKMGGKPHIRGKKLKVKGEKYGVCDAYLKLVRSIPYFSPFTFHLYTLPATWCWRWRRRSTWAMWLMVSWVWSTIMASLVVITSLIVLAPLALANLLCILLATAALALVILMVCVVTRTSSAILSVVMVTRT